MRIGYACITVGVPNAKYRNCILKNATPSNLINLIEHNLNVLDKVMDYNIENHIQMFRISSDIIPFGSHPINTVNWLDDFDEKLKAIGKKALAHNIRLSMHPGQYTVLNSPNPQVVERSILDLKYHSDFLDGLGLSSQHKMILHIGGIYGDKEAAMQRFIQTYNGLSDSIKKRLIIENDDKSYTIDDVLSIANCIDIPVVFDNLHHAILHTENDIDEIEIINKVKQTWKAKDGMQKIHYSEQDESKKVGSHSESVTTSKFIDFCQRLKRNDIDIMLEVKDKNLSAIKCMHSLTDNPRISKLETEWRHYKYLILEHSPQIYQQIRKLLVDKSSYPVVRFYCLIEEALAQEVAPKHAVNAAQHIWGYFKKNATDKEKLSFNKLISNMDTKQNNLSMKKFLYKLANTYQKWYLISSYYFISVD